MGANRIYKSHERHAAIALAQRVGVMAAARELGIYDRTIKKWADEYGEKLPDLRNHAAAAAARWEKERTDPSPPTAAKRAEEINAAAERLHDPRADIATKARDVVLKVLDMVLADEIKVKSEVGAQRLIESCHKVLRLEGGEATQINGNATREEILATIEDFRAKANERKALRAVPADGA